MKKQQPKVTYGGDVMIKPRAVEPGGQTLSISYLGTVQPVGSNDEDNVIRIGEEFDVVMDVEFTPLLSDLGAEYIVTINALNMETGNASVYNTKYTGNLPGPGETYMEFRQKFTATETGVFLLSGSIGLPASKLYDFSLGRFAGTEDPDPRGLRYKVASFYVYDPDA